MVDNAKLYGDLWADEASELEAEIRQSLAPRDPDSLFAIFATFEPKPGQVVLDIGCRDASYAIELHHRFGVEVIALDPVPLHIERAQSRIDAAGLAKTITPVIGGIERIPAPDGAVDHIWCRDVLNHVALAKGLTECARVLRPGGGMLVYQTFATDALAPDEAARLYAALAIVPPNMDPLFFTATARVAGLRVVRADPIDSEWREGWLESGGERAQAMMDDLLWVARIHRREEKLVERYGRDRVEALRGGCLWGIYQMLGKLRPLVYVLSRD
ncbi:MAG: class I SAM-dependent methyltransferase [Chloroflexota bacterium]|nr:class I SAM-dependent methyltransferase [Chloroflexota bacterium]